MRVMSSDERQVAEALAAQLREGDDVSLEGADLVDGEEPRLALDSVGYEGRITARMVVGGSVLDEYEVEIVVRRKG